MAAASSRTVAGTGMEAARSAVGGHGRSGRVDVSDGDGDALAGQLDRHPPLALRPTTPTRIGP